MNYVFPFKENFYIYKITNDLNDKIYVGRTKVPGYRKRQHVSASLDPAKIKVMQKIHLAIKELGHEHFTFEVFEACDNYSKSCEREVYWINFYNSDDDQFGYNEKSGPNGPIILTDEQRKILSLRIIGEKNPMFGKKHTTEALQKMSDRMSGDKNPFYGKIHTDETKTLIGKSSKGRCAGENNAHAKLTLEIVIQIREDWKTGKYTKVALGKKYNVTAVTIGNIISGKTWK
jgi:group I intron endonuclease